CQRTERGAERKPHAQSTDEHMRLLDRLQLLRRERGKCGFGAREATVHQLVGAKLDGKLGATAHQAQFPVSAGNTRGIDFYPGNHEWLLAHGYQLLSS